MTTDFEMVGGIVLVQGKYQLDLHNFFDFQEVRYSVAERSASLEWKRGPYDPGGPDEPAMVRIQFQGVREFRFLPRDAAMPFTEDACLHAMGALTDEAWSKGRVLPMSVSNDDWLTAFEFQSGAVIALKADHARASIVCTSDVHA